MAVHCGLLVVNCLPPAQRWAGRCRADNRVCGRPDSPAPRLASCGCGWSPAARGWCRGSWCSHGNWTCWGSERRDPERRASPPRAYLERQTVRQKSIWWQFDTFLVSEFRCLPLNRLCALTSYIQRCLTRHRLAPALTVKSRRLSSIHRQVHHPVEGYQLYCVKLPIVHRLSTVCQTHISC